MNCPVCMREHTTADRTLILRAFIEGTAQTVNSQGIQPRCFLEITHEQKENEKLARRAARRAQITRNIVNRQLASG